MLLQAMTNSLKAKRKIETLKRKYKEESNGNFCTKKYNNLNKNAH